MWLWSQFLHEAKAVVVSLRQNIMNNKSNNFVSNILASIEGFIGMCIIQGSLMVVMWLFLCAPMLGVYIEAALMTSYNTLDRRDIRVTNKMRYVWIFLWLFTIVMWTMPIVMVIKLKNNCMP